MVRPRSRYIHSPTKEIQLRAGTPVFCTNHVGSVLVGTKVLTFFDSKCCRYTPFCTNQNSLLVQHFCWYNPFLIFCISSMPSLNDSVCNLLMVLYCFGLLAIVLLVVNKLMIDCIHRYHLNTNVSLKILQLYFFWIHTFCHDCFSHASC